MARRIYIGPFDEIELDVTGAVVRRGEAVEVDDSLAARLDEQPANWAKPNTKAAKDVDPPVDPPPVDPPLTFDGMPVDDATSEQQQVLPTSQVVADPAVPERPADTPADPTITTDGS